MNSSMRTHAGSKMYHGQKSQVNNRRCHFHLKNLRDLVKYLYRLTLHRNKEMGMHI